MIYFIEQWNAKEEWKSLKTEEKREYMSQVGAHIGDLLGEKVKILSWSKNDPNTSRRAGYDYFAIWSFADQESVDHFQNLVENAGWYNYFEQTNLKGEQNSVHNIINEIISI